MPFHRDSAKEIENLVQTFQHSEQEKIKNQYLYKKYFAEFLEIEKKKIKNVLDYLYTVDGIIPFFLKGLLGEAPKFHFDSYEMFINSHFKDFNESLVYTKLFHFLKLPREEFENNQNDFWILLKNISYFEYKLNLVFDIVFERLAKNASVLPEFIIAKIARVALTPYMCANIVRFMSESQIVSLLQYFDTNFLTEVVNELDLSITLKLMKKISNQKIEEIFKTMLKKEYYQKMVSIYENYNDNIEIYKEVLSKYNQQGKKEILNKIKPYFFNEEKFVEFQKILNLESS
ncbi:MAG: hypothetical protein ACK4UJ_00500 [Leptonema sp. (in: bacteria)]